MLMIQINRVENSWRRYIRQGKLVIGQFIANFVTMLRQLIVLLAIIALCYCEMDGVSVGRRKKPHIGHKKPYYLLYGGGLIYYLGFLLVKIKIVVVLGTIFAMMLFFGKLFALVKYTGLLKHSYYDSGPEKIYIQPDHHEFSSTPYGGHHGGISYDPPSDLDSSYSGVTFDKLPPNAELSGGSQYGPPQGFGYGRSSSDNTFSETYNMFMELVRKSNITEMAFDQMKLNTEECRRKFVCKADCFGKYSSILGAGLKLLSDDNYEKYKTNQTITSVQDCDRLYPNCTEDVTT